MTIEFKPSGIPKEYEFTLVKNKKYDYINKKAKNRGVNLELKKNSNNKDKVSIVIAPNNEKELISFFQSISSTKSADKTFKDVLNSFEFEVNFDLDIRQARDFEEILAHSSRVYKDIAENKVSNLKKYFSFSTHLLQKLTFPKETKFLASKEHYDLLKLYIRAIECSENYDIKGIFEAFNEIIKLEIPREKVSIGFTDSVLNIYLNNIRCWFVHYACTLYLISKFDTYKIIDLKEVIEFINSNLAIQKRKGSLKEQWKEQKKEKIHLLTASSIYGSIRIVGNTFSFLRQWTEAYIRLMRDLNENKKISDDVFNKEIKEFTEFTSILNNIQKKAALISNRIPFIIEKESNIRAYAEGYATFVLHKIAIFLFKIGSAIEDYNYRTSDNSYENSLEQMIFSIKMFYSHYSYTLGLKNIECLDKDFTIKKIYTKYTESFVGVEDFLKQNDKINAWIWNVEEFLKKVLKNICDQGYFAKHRTRYDNENGYFSSYKKYSHEKLRDFEECNPELFDKGEEIIKMGDNFISSPQRDMGSINSSSSIEDEVNDSDVSQYIEKEIDHRILKTSTKEEIENEVDLHSKKIQEALESAENLPSLPKYDEMFSEERTRILLRKLRFKDEFPLVCSNEENQDNFMSMAITISTVEQVNQLAIDLYQSIKKDKIDITKDVGKLKVFILSVLNEFNIHELEIEN